MWILSSDPEYCKKYCSISLMSCTVSNLEGTQHQKPLLFLNGGSSGCSSHFSTILLSPMLMHEGGPSNSRSRATTIGNVCEDRESSLQNILFALRNIRRNVYG